VVCDLTCADDYGESFFCHGEPNPSLDCKAFLENCKGHGRGAPEKLRRASILFDMKNY
jgi:hypothetical protein